MAAGGLWFGPDCVCAGVAPGGGASGADWTAEDWLSRILEGGPLQADEMAALAVLVGEPMAAAISQAADDLEDDMEYVFEAAGQVGQFLGQYGSSGPEKGDIATFVQSHPQLGGFFQGPYSDFARELQAFASGKAAISNTSARSSGLTGKARLPARPLHRPSTFSIGASSRRSTGIPPN